MHGGSWGNAACVLCMPAGHLHASRLCVVLLLCIAGYARILVTASVATWVSIQGGLPYGASKVGHN
jgi:membrane protein YqaA with SNARE-associated domain